MVQPNCFCITTDKYEHQTDSKKTDRKDRQTDIDNTDGQLVRERAGQRYRQKQGGDGGQREEVKRDCRSNGSEKQIQAEAKG